MEICSKNNFSESDLDFSGDKERKSVSEQLALIKTRQDKLLSEEKAICDEVTKYAQANVDILRKLTDYQNILRERYQAFACGEFTDSAVVTSFWVPVSNLPEIEAKLAPLGIYELVTTDPSKG